MSCIMGSRRKYQENKIERRFTVINIEIDYWTEYYRLKKLIESGKGRPEDYTACRKTYNLAMTKSGIAGC